MRREILLSLLLSPLLFADGLEKDLMGFDDRDLKFVEQKDAAETSAGTQKADEAMDGFDEANTTEGSEEKHPLIEGLTGKLTQKAAYAYNGTSPHDKLASLKTSLFLDYDHKFESGWRIKTNAKWYYDARYDLRDEHYSSDELKELRHEAEIFDAYVEGSVTESLDLKVGRQVVVWGRSDTIRITDVLNPLDNRTPGMVDIEDLRLPVGMIKADYFVGDWRITPIAIVEQRFSKNPPFGSAFNPMPDPHLVESSPTDVTYALSVGGEFSGWDVNFYAAHMYDDAGYVKFGPRPTLEHEKIDMAGVALNVLSGAWLFKTELAYFDGLKYTATQEQEFSRTDALLGLEYKGIADTLISYDVSVRHINSYNNSLLKEHLALEEDTYQHAFRVSSDFLNATLTANYLISLYGKKLDEGGFQRAWVKYELAEGLNLNAGVVDYIGGSTLFDTIKENDMLFADLSYSF